jgi:hypothetical protein
LRAALSHGIVPWTLTWTAIGFAALALAFASGCSRAVLVPESSPVRIGPETKARVYTRAGDEWVLSENRVQIPEGWYCVPPSFVEEER